jgi:hypothetical protein
MASGVGGLPADCIPAPPAVRSPFRARPKSSSALKRWALRKITLHPRGAAGNSMASERRASRKGKRGVWRLRQNLRSMSGADQEASRSGRLAPDRDSIRAALVEPASRQTGKRVICPACRRKAVQARYRHGRCTADAFVSDQPCGQVPTQVCCLSPRQACSHANRHAGRKADSHDCGQTEGTLGRRAAAFWLRESSRNMKASAKCYNLQHIPFDLSATLCLNGAPNDGRISDAFTMASLGPDLRAVHRLP